MGKLCKKYFLELATLYKKKQILDNIIKRS